MRSNRGAVRARAEPTGDDRQVTTADEGLRVSATSARSAITQDSQMNDSLLMPKDAAAVLSVSVDTLSRYRMTGVGPKFVKLTHGQQGMVRYRRSDLDAWIASRTVQSTSEDFGG
jgi:predicted DNA-binding transcriptional regulator AlpA